MARHDGPGDAPTAPESSGGVIDGRRLRAERSRERIVDALLKLVQSGEMNPSAAMVAETARVSLRTVFRHFEEMESLYLEMGRVCEARFLPTFRSPYRARDWQGRLREHLARRVSVFEDVMFLRICTMQRRFRSDVLMEDYHRFLELERTGLEALLPEERLADGEWVAALDVALSFESYRRLRQERGLSPDAAGAALSRMLDMIIAGAAR